MKIKALNSIKGGYGESLAQSFIKKQLKYKILENNFKCVLGEVDIIAKDKNVIVFIEVKYKSSFCFGEPREKVTLHKQQKIKQVAQFYLKSKKMLDSMVRFDVIEVLDDKIEHIFDAFR